MVSHSPIPSDPVPAGSFGELLRRFRQQAGLTQEALAERANVSARAISDLERGVKQGPHRTTVALLAAGLRLSAEDRLRLESSIHRERGPWRVAAGERRLSPVPEPPTSLVGRQRDVEEAVHRVRWGGVRLLTLTGPGGVGKTRVAMAVAQALRDDCPGGPAYVSLASLRDFRLVATAIANALGLQESSGRSPEDLVFDHLRDREAILVVDNFEQVVGASSLLSLLLQECPRLKVIVTSRTALKIQGEHRMEIAPLEVPGHGMLSHGGSAAHYPAVELFAQRAQAVRRDFAITDANLSTVVEICRRLDGLPLAIELATARVAHLSPPALLMRLSRRLSLLQDGPTDLPPRQQTMRDTIAWSYDLLDESQRRVLRQLSVFAGGWSLEAAEAVCGRAGTGRLGIFEPLSALIDSSLVLVDDQPEDEPHYRMLETIREYGLEELAAAGEADAASGSHAGFFLELAEQAEPELTGSEQAEWLGRLEIEVDNVRAALSWARSAEDTELGLRVSAALWRFWLTRGHTNEGRTWICSFLPSLERVSSDLLRARALYAAGALAFGQASLDEARQHFEASLALYRKLGDRTQTAITLNGLGVIASARAEHDRALSLFREAVALHREAGNNDLLAPPLNNIANLVRYQGRSAEATALYEECIEIYRRTENAGYLANTLHNLALVLQERGDLDRADELARESLALYRELDSPSGRAHALTALSAIALDRGENERARSVIEESVELARIGGDGDIIGVALINLGTLEYRRGEYERAEELARESLTLFQQSGSRRLHAYALENLAEVARARGNLAQAQSLHEEGLDVCREVGYAVGIADALERLASLACAQRAWERAARQYATAAALRAQLGAPVPPVQQAEVERDCTHARKMLSNEAFDAAWQAGWSAGEQGQLVAPAT